MEETGDERKRKIEREVEGRTEEEEGYQNEEYEKGKWEQERI